MTSGNRWRGREGSPRIPSAPRCLPHTCDTLQRLGLSPFSPYKPGGDGVRAWHCARHLEGGSPPLGSHRGLPRDPRAPRGPTASPRRPSPASLAPLPPPGPSQLPVGKRPEPTARPSRRPQQAPAAPRGPERERSSLRWLPHPSLPVRRWNSSAGSDATAGCAGRPGSASQAGWG